MFPTSRMISSSLKTLVSLQNHQLLRRCPVSGTAKGKSKLKSGHPLKRSTIRIKKASSTSDAPRGGRSRNEAIKHIKQMMDYCLNAPTPVRYLTAKERLYEAEREKLGLISKERQREIDQAKAAAKGKGRVEDPVIMGTPGLDYITLGLVDKEAIPKYELTVEDGRWLAKEYSRFLMRKHRARQAAKTELLNLKEAIAALPDHLHKAAMVPDFTPFPVNQFMATLAMVPDFTPFPVNQFMATLAMVPDFTPFPVNQFMATLTPPIEGYIEKVKEAALKLKGKEKLR